jgi:hypothetical protein
MRCSVICMGSSSNNFFTHYVTQSQSHYENIKSSRKTRLGNFSHDWGKPVAGGKPIQANYNKARENPSLGENSNQRLF